MEDSIGDCDLSGYETISVGITNAGYTVIPTGDSISLTYIINMSQWSQEYFVLESDLNISDTVYYDFVQTADFSMNIPYGMDLGMAYADDQNASNNATWREYYNVSPTPDITQGDTVYLDQSLFPYTLDLTENYIAYYWQNDSNTVSSDSGSFVIAEYGWYYVMVWDTADCIGIDSILLLDPVNKYDPGIYENMIRIYPNPNSGDSSKRVLSLKEESSGTVITAGAGKGFPLSSGSPMAIGRTISSLL